MNANQIIHTLENSKPLLQQMAVLRIGLFGSYVRNQQSEGSDIDIMVTYQQGKKSFRKYNQLLDFLEHSFGNRVELVTEESISQFILPHIKKEIRYVQVFD